MATKAVVTGVVVSDKMDKTVKVAIERQIRNPLYGKTQRRTSTFLAHDEQNEAKVGDRIESIRGIPVAQLGADMAGSLLSPRQVQVGQPVAMVIVRDGRQDSVSITPRAPAP